MKEIHVEREEVGFMCHTVGTRPIGKLPTSHLGCKHVRPCGERIFLHLRKHRTRVPTLKSDSQYSESYLTSIRHLVIPSSWVCHRYPPPLEFLRGIEVEPVRWLRSKDGGCTGCWFDRVV